MRHHLTLTRLLEVSAVLAHPWVTGELALGNINNREEIIRLLQNLPQAMLADNNEVLMLISRESLYSTGIGYVDAQLLAATRLTLGATL